MPSDRIPSWDEWSSQLTEEQRKYSLYKILEAIDKKLTERVISCEERFERLEKRKSWNSTESLMGGIIGGILAVIGSWAFWKGGP